MLVPLLHGGFSVLVDPACADAPSGPCSELSRLLAHEFAHTFFYSCGQPPARLFPLTPEEEIFCDLFAEEVLRRR
jgi:hypothetical protein